MVDIIVCLKNALDVSQITTDAGSGKPVLAGVPRKASDFDRNALEAAVAIKEKAGSGKITVLSVSDADANQPVREALAAGGDEGYIVSYDGGMDYFSLVNVAAAAVKKIGNCDLIICGEVSIDWYSGQFGPRLAGALGMSQVTNVTKLDMEGDKVKATREFGNMLIEQEARLPAVVTVNKNINEPRLPNLMQIMGASSKPIQQVPSSDLAPEAEAFGGIVEKVKLDEIQGLTMDRKRQMIEADPAEAAGQVAGVIKEFCAGGE